MAPEWGRAVRPLVLVYTAVAVVITIVFGADVNAQAGAYATGVLAMMTSAAFAVSLTAWRRGFRRAGFAFGVLTVVFVYALVANEIQRPDGIVIASFFILAIVFSSLVSRVYRSLALRQERIEMDETAGRFIDEMGKEIHIVAHRRRRGAGRVYALTAGGRCGDTHIPTA